MITPMDEFISSSRKSLRVPLRCAAWLELSDQACQGHTEDLGPRGCRLVLPTRLEQGAVVRLMLWHDLGAGVLGVSATVVWAAAEAPWRHGLAFAAADRATAEAWFEGVLAGHPELLLDDPVPDHVALSSRVHPTGLAAPPSPLGVEEATVLRLAAGRPSVGELQERLGADWTRAQRALFALLMRGQLALDAGPPPGPRPAGPAAPRRPPRA